MGDNCTNDSSRCPTCEVKDWGYKNDGKLIPVWEKPEDYNRGEGPDFIGCTNCGTMREVDTDS